MSRTRSWLLTINNPVGKDVDNIKKIAKTCEYCIWAREIGKKNSVPHIHAWFYFANARTLASLRKVFERAHFDNVKGKPDQVRHYIAKLTKKSLPEEKPSEEIHEYGTLPSQGKRNDLESLCDRMVSESISITEISEQYPTLYVKFERGLTSLREKLQKPRNPDEPPVVIWLYGLAGVGKTRFAYDYISADRIYIKDGTQWWNGYDHHYCILIDDFDGRWPYRDFLRLLDRYPYQGQCKGGYLQINSPVIIITCEFPPSHYWGYNELEQITRRITHVIEVN